MCFVRVECSALSHAARQHGTLAWNLQAWAASLRALKVRPASMAGPRKDVKVGGKNSV